MQSGNPSTPNAGLRDLQQHLQGPLQPHLVQVNLAVRILEVQVQFKRRDALLGDLDVFQVGYGIDVLGKTEPARAL